MNGLKQRRWCWWKPLSIILRHSLITCLISQNLPSELSLGPLNTSIKSIHTRVGYVNEITDPSFRPLLQERLFEAISFVCVKLSPTNTVMLGSAAQQTMDCEQGTCIALPQNMSQIVLYYACVNFTTKQITFFFFFFGICCVTHEQLHWYQVDYPQQGAATMLCLYNIRNILGF